MHLPKHVSIIMDGNGRWAQKRALPRVAGHRAGVAKVRSTVEVCLDVGVEVLSIFAFSSENWLRPVSEVSALMTLFVDVLDKELLELHEQGVKLRFIGAREQLAPMLQERIRLTEAKTANNKRLTLVIAIAYGGRDDIIQACKQTTQDVMTGKLDLADVSAMSFAQHLATRDLPEPDLFIRTGGEQRISNFLLWDLAYTELWFTDVLWPAFDQAEFMLALENYSQRERRFGLTSEQLNKPAC
jgi:undecaprenyl diphosphate synthase